MKSYFIFFTFIVFTIICCNTSTDNNKYNDDGPSDAKNKTPGEVFTIDRTVRNTIVTASGILLDIAANAIFSKNKEVKLQVISGITLEEMIQHNLETRSPKGLLSSGGMVYVNSLNQGDSIAIPIKVMLPAARLDPKMAVYKGRAVDKKIIWDSLKPLPLIEPMLTLKKGEELFTKNCISCHSVGKDATGPALAGITHRRSKEFLYQFVRNSAKLIAFGSEEGDYVIGGHSSQTGQSIDQYYANCIYKQWGKQAMTQFQLSDKEIDQIFTYIENEGKQLPDYAERCRLTGCDSCAIYLKLTEDLNNEKSILVNQNSEFFELKQNIPAAQNWIDSKGEPTKVSPSNTKAVYYEIKIETFGWFNIDKELRNPLVEFKVAIDKVLNEEPFNLNLIIPTKKVLANGGLLEDGINYGFQNINGKANLPLGDTALVYAFKEAEDGYVYYAEARTQIKLINFVRLQPEKIKVTEISQKIKQLTGEGIEIKINETKNANAIRQIDQQNREALKWRPHSCGCGENLDTSAVAPASAIPGAPM